MLIILWVLSVFHDSQNEVLLYRVKRALFTLGQRSFSLLIFQVKLMLRNSWSSSPEIFPSELCERALIWNNAWRAFEEIFKRKIWLKLRDSIPSVLSAETQHLLQWKSTTPVGEVNKHIFHFITHLCTYMLYIAALFCCSFMYYFVWKGYWQPYKDTIFMI